MGGESSIFQEGSVQSLIPSDTSWWWWEGVSTFCEQRGRD